MTAARPLFVLALAFIALATGARATGARAASVREVTPEVTRDVAPETADEPALEIEADAKPRRAKRSSRQARKVILAMPVAQDVELEVRTAHQASLGPTDFRRRASAATNPMSPRGRYEDKASAVLIAGVGSEKLKLEGSVFNSRRAASVPQSVAARLSMTPIDAVKLEVSYGSLLSSERHDRGARLSRVTASTTATHALGGATSATTALWGLSVPSTDEPLTNSALLESSVDLDDHHNVFGRLEYMQRSAVELGIAGTTPLYDVGCGSLGYVYSFAPIASLVPSVGVAGSLDVLDLRLADSSAVSPGAFVFLRGTVH